MASAAIGSRRPAGFWLVAAALAALTLLSWYYLVAFPMPMPQGAGVREQGYVWLTFLMWLVMMIAMMTPSAAPAVLLFHRVQRGALTRTASFVTGYLAAWAAFSLAATIAQVLLIEAGTIDTMGAAMTRWTSAAILSCAAMWQWLPAKGACLRQCRAPAEFLVEHYHPGTMGAMRTGIRHGAYCVGCCWALMLLLFVGGVMNLAWVGAITVMVALEKLAPQAWLTRALISAGLLVVAVMVALGVPVK